jgi:hypothetical protein
MNDDELENMEMVHYRMDAEGFHYCFKHYSDFNEINDEKFHELRLKYLDVANELEKYINEKIENLRNF